MFRDRHDAGIRLARALRRYRGAKDALVLAVPRGGLPVGREIARALGLRLDVVLTKKIGHPDNPEFAVGAVSLTDEALDAELIAREAVPREHILSAVARIRTELRARGRLYRGSADPPSVAGKTVILTDDGAATGRTLLAAVDLLRRQGARRIVVALPVAAPDAVAALKARADEAVCLEAPESFFAVGESYGDFNQVSDAEAVAILREAAATSAA